MNPMIARRLQIFDLDSQQLSELREAGALILEDIEDVLDRFYDRVRADPNASAFFSGGEQMARAARAQSRHWRMLLTGSFDQTYLDSAARVSKTHFDIELPFADYLGAYARVVSDIQAQLLNKMVGEDVAKIASYTSAITRVFYLDIELIIDAIFEEQKKEQAAAFRHLETGIERLANCDLVHKVPGPEESDYPPRFEPIRVSLNGATAHLNGVMGEVNETMETLRTVAHEMSTATSSLAKRTESQAASLEETTASVHEVTQTVATSVKNTDSAKSVAQEARSSAEAGREVVGSAANAMEKIETSSREIAQIVSLINDVAFQTNLLALNAGVEAARAGEAGRGFAVVASEVRALSERSTEAVKKIEALIDTSSINVKSGVELVGQAAKAIEAIVDDFARVTDLATEIATASSEQSIVLNEISTSVTHLDQVTQQNAAMVEETTAAGQILRQNTDRLAEIVGSFALATDNGGAQNLGRVA